jgi:hypothetical protein
MTTHSYEGPILPKVAAEIVDNTRAPTNRKVDLVALANDLNRVCHWYSQYRMMDVQSHAETGKLLKAVSAHSRTLTKILFSPKYSRTISFMLAQAADRIDPGGQGLEPLGLGPHVVFPDDSVEFSHSEVFLLVSQGLPHLADWADEAVHLSKNTRLPQSPLEALVAVQLPRVYETHFALPFGAGTSGDSRPDGPGIRFVLGFMDAASIKQKNGEPYSAETIRTYWSKSRAGKGRREPDKIRKKK